MSEPGEIKQPNPSLKNCADSLSGDANTFRLYDEKNKNEVNLLKALSSELNAISSAPVTVYLLLDTTVDNLYGEEKNVQYSAPFEQIVGHYSPSQIKFTLSLFGIDSDIDTVFYFTQDELLGKLGRVLQHGDLLYDKDNRLFEVTEVIDDTNFNYEWISQYVMCRRYQGDKSFLLGDYNNDTELSNREEIAEQEAGDLPPSAEKRNDP